MAIIYSYPLNDDIKILDELVGTTKISINGDIRTVTRNFLLQDLAMFFIDKGGLQKELILTTNNVSGPATLDQITGTLNIPRYDQSVIIPAALTKVNDTNVTLTLGGSPSNALLQEVSLTLGWTGTLNDDRITSSSIWNAKQNAITTGTNLQYLRGDLSLATFPTNLSNFTNGPGYITSAALAPYITTVTAAATYEPKITAGTTAQYWRGDKTWQPFPSIGGGDMFKSVYDINNNGIVDAAQAMVTQGRNSTGVPLYKGTIVYISGATGQLPNFVKSQANLESTSAGTFGVVNADIANNSDGWVTTIGLLEGLDTRTTAVNPFTDVALAIGNTIYLHPTIAGYVTNIKPSAPNHIVYIGKVVNIGPATQGAIVYRMQNGYELDEIHDVAISNPLNNQGLFYETATTLWKNKSIATVLGFTPANDNNVVHKTGAETINGIKTFNDDIIVNGIYINKGSNNAVANIAIGLNTLDNTSGNQNTAIGYQAATKDNILGPYPISFNTVVGYQAYGDGEGNNNTAIGWKSLFSSEANNNSALGYSSGLLLTTGFQNTFIGAFAGGIAGQLISAQNSTAIGYNAFTTKNNQVVLGNSLVTETVLRGTVLVDGGVSNAVDSLIVGGPTKCTQYKLTALNTAPASATAVGTLGDIRVTSGFIYVCIATNTWVRSALTTW